MSKHLAKLKTSDRLTCKFMSCLSSWFKQWNDAIVHQHTIMRNFILYCTQTERILPPESWYHPTVSDFIFIYGRIQLFFKTKYTVCITSYARVPNADSRAIWSLCLQVKYLPSFPANASAQKNNHHFRSIYKHFKWHFGRLCVVSHPVQIICH